MKCLICTRGVETAGFETALPANAMEASRGSQPRGISPSVMSATMIDIAENPVSRIIAALVEWFTPRDGPTGPERVERFLRTFTLPLVESHDEDELGRVFSEATERLHELFRVVPFPSATEFQHRSSEVARKVPWLLQRVAGDLEPTAFVGEFGALLQLHLHTFERHLQHLPPDALERMIRRAREDLELAPEALGDSPTIEAVAALFALVGLSDALGRSDSWRRRYLLTRGLGALRKATEDLPVEHSFAWHRWHVRAAREIGLWPVVWPDPTAAIAERLGANPPNRTALVTLSERFREGASVVYVGDVQATFDGIVGGERFFASLDERLAYGEAYERGDLSVDDLAGRWSLDVPDAIALLEEMKIVRSPEVLRLTDDDRRARLAKINADRLDRRGVVAYDPDTVRRSVIASQRIEGIDAREHLSRTMPSERPRG